MAVDGAGFNSPLTARFSGPRHRLILIVTEPHLERRAAAIAGRTKGLLPNGPEPRHRSREDRQARAPWQRRREGPPTAPFAIVQILRVTQAAAPVLPTGGFREGHKRFRSAANPTEAQSSEAAQHFWGQVLTSSHFQSIVTRLPVSCQE